MKFYCCILLLCLPLLNIIKAQTINSRPEDFYLIDNLNFSKIGKPDSILIDTTLQKFHQAVHDTTKLRLLSHIIENCVENHFWEGYNEILMEIAKRTIDNNPPIEIAKIAQLYYGKGLNYFGFAESRKGNLESSSFYFKESIEHFKKNGFMLDLARSYCNLGFVCKKAGKLKEALDLYHKSLIIREKLNDKKGVAYSYNNIGAILMTIGHYEEALEYLRKSLIIKYEIGDKWSVGYSLYRISEIHELQGNYQKGLDSLYKAKKIWKDLENLEGIANVKGRIGRLNIKQNQKELGLKFLYESLALYQKIGNPISSYDTYQEIADLFYELDDLEKSKKYGIIGFDLAKKSGEPDPLQKSSLLLSKIFKIENRCEEAFSMLKLHGIMKDSVYSKTK